MLPTAVWFALLAMVSWGLWAVLANVATESIEPAFAMIVSYATSVAVAGVYVAVRSGEVTVVRHGILFALAAGVFAGIGGVAFYAGLEAGRTGIVTTISAMYFIIAGLIGILFLGETLSWHDILGVGFAAVAVVLLAY